MYTNINMSSNRENEEREPLLGGSQPSRNSLSGGQSMGASNRPPVVGGDFYAAEGLASDGLPSASMPSTSNYSTENGQLSHKYSKRLNDLKLI